MNLKRPFRARTAFTLIEILIVVGIMGLTFSIGLPAFVRSFGRKQGMTKALTELEEACKSARADAIINAHDSELVFHPLEGTFSAAGKNYQFPDNITIDILGVNFIQFEKADLARVQFKSNGTCDEFTILIHSSDGAYRKLSLDTVTALSDVENIR